MEPTLSPNATLQANVAVFPQCIGALVPVNMSCSMNGGMHSLTYSGIVCGPSRHTQALQVHFSEEGQTL